MDALQIVFRAVDETVAGGYMINDTPPWEEPAKFSAEKAPVLQAKPPEKPEPPKNSGFSDEEGLQRAYASPDNIYVDGDHMYVAGTTPSPLGDSLCIHSAKHSRIHTGLDR